MFVYRHRQHHILWKRRQLRQAGHAPGLVHRMFAGWDCILRKLRAGGDGRDKPGHDGVGESIISVLGLMLRLIVARANARSAARYPR